MKRYLFLLSVILCICCSSCKKEKLAIAGSGWQEIAIVDKKNGIIEWRHALDKDEECNDIEVMPDGSILYAYSKGAKLITRNHETIWDYKAKENEEIHSATRLDNGGFMIAVCGEPARIVELDNDGKQTKEIPFYTVTLDVNKQFRHIAQISDGSYIIPLIEKRKIIQISSDGRNKGSLYIGSELTSVKTVDSDKVLVSCGKDGRFMELNPSLRIDSAIITSSIKGGSLLYVAEIFPYKNGNKLIANSNMYSDDKSQPLLIEIDPNNEIVWKLNFNKEIKNITSVYSFFE